MSGFSFRLGRKCGGRVLLACAVILISHRDLLVLRIVNLVLTMTSNSTNDSSSILRDGKLRPGIYKIKNIDTKTYLDIHERSMQVCSRPAEKLEEGGGLVRPFS